MAKKTIPYSILTNIISICLGFIIIVLQIIITIIIIIVIIIIISHFYILNYDKLNVINK